ncbi:hypothetical protein Gpo141_00001169 [Globisporangium polare]
MKVLQQAVSVSSRGRHFAAKLLRAQRAQGAHAPPSRRALLETHSLRCFAVRAQPPPSSSSLSDEDDDTKSSNAGNKKDVLRDANSSSSSSNNPWRHFQAFSGMDAYMDVTLIHYENKGAGAESEPTDDPPQPDVPQKPTQQD